MAFHTNNKNVVSYLFLKNDEILIAVCNSTTNKDITVSKRLKCMPSVIVQTPTNPAKKNNKQPDPEQNFITSACISNCNTYIAAGDSNNSLHLWKNDNQEWKIVSVRSVVRKCHKIIFTNAASEIIVADRGGDVFTFSVSKSSDPGKFLLGHISLILDMSISSNDQYLATCDRDGKVRVSSYPNSYNIVSYCLGHQEFVSSVQFLPLCGEVLLSSSGDGTMRLWNYADGSLKTTVSLHENDLLCQDCNITGGDGNVDDVILSDNLALSEKQVMFSVRSVKYNHKYKVFGVLLHLQSGVAIYQLLDDRFVFKQFINLETPPLDVMFTARGDMLVLTKKTGDAVVYFEYDEVSKLFSKGEDGKLPGLKEVKMFYEDHKQIPFQDDFVSLFKRVYDVPDDECSEPKEKKNKAE